MQKVSDIPLALSYDDVLLVPQYSTIQSRADVDLTVKLSPRITLSLPIVTAPMSDVVDTTSAISLFKCGGLAFSHRFNTVGEQADEVAKIKQSGALIGATVGCCHDSYENRANALVKAGVDVLLLDVAHGHMRKAVEITRILKQRFGKSVDIHAGVVATYDGAVNLYTAGADCVHAGIGGGSICTTRIMTGCGVPNITTAIDCARAARKFKKTFVMDAGIKNSGDIVKALAAGASAVRVGNMLAGLKESPGKLVTIDGVKYKIYNGSTSYLAKKNHLAKKVTNSKNYLHHIEGVEGIVAYKGEMADHLKVIEAGIRSGFSYCGAKNIRELWAKAKFIRVTPMGMRESASHDILPQQNTP